MTSAVEGLTLQRHTADQARAVRATVEDVYRRSYVEAIATGDPFNTPEPFMRRFDAYTARDTGFTLVLARIHGEPAGQTWGWPLAAENNWWPGLRLDEGDEEQFTRETGSRTFALSEIMVCAEHAGHGIARALQDELLRDRPEQRATLLVDADNTRAYTRYTSWGWYRVGQLRPGWPEAPLFDVLIRDLRRPEPTPLL